VASGRQSSRREEVGVKAKGGPSEQMKEDTAIIADIETGARTEKAIDVGDETPMSDAVEKMPTIDPETENEAAVQRGRSKDTGAEAKNVIAVEEMTMSHPASVTEREVLDHDQGGADHLVQGSVSEIVMGAEMGVEMRLGNVGGDWVRLLYTTLGI